MTRRQFGSKSGFLNAPRRRLRLSSRLEPVSSNRSLRCGETEFSGRRQRGRNGCEDSENAVAETKPRLTTPPIRSYSPATGKSPLERECVVGLRGLELRAKHAVAIEPVSRE